MKKALLVVVCFLITAKLLAQDCSQYVYLQKNKTIESTAYNQAGAVMRRNVAYISDVSTVNGTTTATASSESFDKDGKSRGKRNITYKCTGGSFSMDMNSNMPQMGNAKFSATFMEYPAGMKVGDHFNDVETQSQMTIGSRTMNMSTKITGRQVVGKETITTPAGTWQALKITYKTTTTMEGGPMAPQTIESTEWYVPNFGIVQFQVFGMTVKLTSIK
jgi:hypothetical protein